MYGHVPEYLDAQALRLRAERAETLANSWRLVGWTFGLALILLVAVVAWQEIHLIGSGQIQTELGDELSLYSKQAFDESTARDAAERKFKVCLSANAGLVDALREFDKTVKDQQLLINDAVELAKRCESSPVIWAATAPAGWQVLGHAW